MKINKYDKNGLRHGLWKIGFGLKIAYIIKYKHGKIHGPFEGYYNNGNLHYKGIAKDGDYYGLWEFFNSDGTPKRIEFHIT
jgi:antitoxin component YwqK of YwqJK toxin-antitoxin module